MEPTKPFNPFVQANLQFDDDKLQVVNDCLTAFKLSDTLNQADLVTVQNRHQERIYTNAVSSNNDNNAIPDPVNEVYDEDDDLEIIGQMDRYGYFDKFIMEFEKAHWLIELPNKKTGNTPLLSAVMLLKSKPESQNLLIECIAALLVLGAKKDVKNFAGITPLAAALESENKFIIELFTTDAIPSKDLLLHLAKKYNNSSMQSHLERSLVKRRFVDALDEFLENDKTNVYERVKAFYAQFPKIFQEKDPATQNTILHDAVIRYISGYTPGIFEVLVLLEMGADIHDKNLDGVSPLNMAESRGNIILHSLMSHKKPTIRVLRGLVQLDKHVDKELVSWLRPKV